jgi:Na+/proline symporter
MVADLLGFATVFALLVWTGSRRARGENEFLVADRSLGLFPLVATLVMTEFNTSTLMAFSAAGYRAGPMALALPFVFLVGLTFYTVTVAKAWKRFDRLSVAELFSVRYSTALGRLVSIMLLLAMTGFSATYVKSLTLLAQPLLPHAPFGVLSAALTATVLMVVLPGGLVSVVRSDVVSFLITLVILPVLLIVGAASSAPLGGLAAAFPADQLTFDPIAQWTHPALPFRFVSTLIVLTCFTYIAAPWYGQKIFAARNERTAFAAVAWAAILVFAFYGVMVLAAAHFRVVSPSLADSQAAVPAMVAAWLPAGLRGVGFAVLFAAALTTLAGVWTAMAAMVAADFGWRESRYVGRQRWIVVGFALASWLGGVFLVDDILNRLILANIPVAALAFALLAGFHWRRANAAGAWASVIVGVAWGVGSFLVVGESGGYTWPWAMYGIPLIFATGVIVSLITPADAARSAAGGRSSGNGRSHPRPRRRRPRSCRNPAAPRRAADRGGPADAHQS